MRNIIAIAATALLLSTTVPAQPHAFLDRSEPRVGGSVRTAPREITMWFTQNLEPAFSNAQVYNAAGARVDQGRARVSRSEPSVLRVAVRALPPGTYRVHWRVLSVDTHTTEGSFSFRVGE